MKHLLLVVRTVVAWVITLLLVFPLIWLLLTAFKTELQAIAVPPQEHLERVRNDWQNYGF